MSKSDLESKVKNLIKELDDFSQRLSETYQDNYNLVAELNSLIIEQNKVVQEVYSTLSEELEIEDTNNEKGKRQRSLQYRYCQSCQSKEKLSDMYLICHECLIKTIK